MKKLLLIAFAAILAACGAPSENDDPTGPVDPAKPIELSTRSDAKVAADNAFAFHLFRETVATADEKQNAFISPLSVTMALGMLYNGTSEAAGREMAAALGVGDLSAAEINGHYKTLVGALLVADPKTQLAIANSIWSRKDFAVKAPFVQTNRDYYDAEVEVRDFALQATVDEINKWCADHTKGKIPSILDAIPADAVMYLINALYFKGEWKWAFKKSDTHDADFTLADGSKTRVQMMQQKGTFDYYSDERMECIEMPYGNGAFGMVVAMPLSREGSLDKMIASLDAASYVKAIAGMHERNLTLKFPRFKQECEFSLVDPVKNLGIGQIFGDGSLTGINDDPRLKVSEIKHKTFVEVNEVGTEAAAVTLVGIEVTSIGPDGQLWFVADRPFLYLIRERSTGAILFIGRMDKPTE